MQPVIKWCGSKRTSVKEILSYFPCDYQTYYEPFVGGGSIAYAVMPMKGVCGDICSPLIDLWNEIKERPLQLSDAYKERWTRLQQNGHEEYYSIRRNFNETHAPEDFLFLSRTCTNGLIRFNLNGEFNNSLHITRDGIKPETLRKIIFDWSMRIQNIEFVCGDYRKTTEGITDKDFIYLDPPYYHTKGMYYGKIDYEDLFGFIESLNNRQIRYALSFDGVRGNENRIVNVPKSLYKRHVLIHSGNSSFNRVITKKKVEVYESLYLNY